MDHEAGLVQRVSRLTCEELISVWASSIFTMIIALNINSKFSLFSPSLRFAILLIRDILFTQNIKKMCLHLNCVFLRAQLSFL